MGKPIHRTVLHRPFILIRKDYMKRVRAMAARARDILLQEQSVILSGYFHSVLIETI
jgi:hypothetical protein